MKTLCKKIMTYWLALMMVVAMAVPVFATEQESNVTGGAFHLYNWQTGKYMNLYGNGNAFINRNVIVFTYTSDNDQHWYIQDHGSGLKVYSAKSDDIGTAYTLNINTDNFNCNIYPDVTSNNGDSQVLTPGTTYEFRIQLARDPILEITVDDHDDVKWGGTELFSWRTL